MRCVVTGWLGRRWGEGRSDGITQDTYKHEVGRSKDTQIPRLSVMLCDDPEKGLVRPGIVGQTRHKARGMQYRAIQNQVFQGSKCMERMNPWKHSVANTTCPAIATQDNATLGVSHPKAQAPRRARHDMLAGKCDRFVCGAPIIYISLSESNQPSRSE